MQVGTGFLGAHHSQEQRILKFSSKFKILKKFGNSWIRFEPRLLDVFQGTLTGEILTLRAVAGMGAGRRGSNRK